jgi:hypothetical protein
MARASPVAARPGPHRPRSVAPSGQRPGAASRSPRGGSSASVAVALPCPGAPHWDVRSTLQRHRSRHLPQQLPQQRGATPAFLPIPRGSVIQQVPGEDHQGGPPVSATVRCTFRASVEGNQRGQPARATAACSENSCLWNTSQRGPRMAERLDFRGVPCRGDFGTGLRQPSPRARRWASLLHVLARV